MSVSDTVLDLSVDGNVCVASGSKHGSRSFLTSWVINGI